MAALRYHIILILLIAATFADGQSIDVMVDSIEIIDKTSLNNIVQVYSPTKKSTQYPSQILNRTSGVTVRNGGPALLTTILNRGMASRHVGLFWSGFNIQSVVNGTYDVGLLPNAFHKSVFHLPNSGGAAGQASIAGALILQPDFEDNSNSIMIGLGSDKNKRLNFQNKINKSKYKHDISLSGRDDENHYTYYNQAVKRTQQDAAIMQWDFTYNSQLMLHPNMNIKIGVWLQEAERIIPPTKTSAYIYQGQEDENYRFSLGGDYFTDNYSISLFSAYFNEKLKYVTPGIYSISDADIYNFGVDFKYKTGTKLGVLYRNDEVSASFFTNSKLRETISFTAGQTFAFGQSQGKISIRWDRVDSDSQPLHILGFFQHDFSSNFALNTTLGRAYTLPSFNDLYWPQGGNETLLTEVSNSADVGAVFVWGAQNRFSANLFYSNIDNWIQWTPQEGVFSPTNQKKIRNIGLELKGVYELLIAKKYTLQVQPSYTWTNSSIIDHYDTPELIGKKSLFIPAHKIALPVNLAYSSWNIEVNTVHYGKRYDTADNSSSVPSYTVMDAEVSKSFKLKSVDTRLSLSIENIWNADYEHIRFYPMPLRLARMNLYTKF